MGASRDGPQQANKLQSMHHNGSFGRYMELKNQKLHEQFREDARGSRQVSKIFSGVTIHVNGVTHPSHQELKHLMASHGGRFANYYTKDTVTHIVCDNLPDTKLKQMLKSRSSLPLVQAAWVVHSITAGKLLPTAHFSIDRLAMAPAQQQLKPFAPRQSVVLDKTEIYSQLNTINADPYARLPESRGHVQPQPAATITDTSKGLRGALEQRSTAAVPYPAVLSSRNDPSCTPMRNVADTTEPSGQQEAVQVSPPKPSAMPAPPGRLVPFDPSEPPPQATWTPEQILAAQRTAQAMRAACDVLKGPPKSTADDPKFLETYFRASRLHFIGTWRMRIEQLIRKERLQPGTSPLPAPASGTADRIIMHVDMDCFFASVAVRHRPELQRIPLAVAHSNHSAGHSEISCVNYVARRCGVRADMWMASARERCPDLVVIPYEFGAYHEVSEQVYRILLRHASIVQPMSCDEAYLDVSTCADPLALAATLRREIRDATHCNASVGIGPSILLAAMATKKAKPDGVFRVQPKDVDRFLLQQPVAALPGVGWSSRGRLEEMGIETIAQLRLVSPEVLQTAFGAKTAHELLRFAHGDDTRQVELPAARKSIGAEVNYGIRFATDADATHFLRELSREVAWRLDLCGARGRTITLKLKRRKANAPVDPPKFLGHGICDNFSKSMSLGSSVCSADALFAVAKELLSALAVPPAEIRGVGISVAKLDGQTQRATGIALPSDMHVPSLALLWKRGGDNGEALEVEDHASGEASGAEAEHARQEYLSDRVGCGSPGCAGVNADSVMARSGDGDRGVGAQGVHMPRISAALPEGREEAPVLGVGDLRTGDGANRGSPDACPHVHALDQSADDVAGACGPVQVMPDLHSLDMSVVDCLPAAMRLELMRAYGLHSKAMAPVPRSRVQATGGVGSRARVRVTPQKRSPVRAEGAERHADALPFAPRKRVRVAMNGLTMSQVDDAVLAELPAEVQAGLREGLPESRGAFRHAQATDELASWAGPGIIHPVPGPAMPEVKAVELTMGLVGEDEDRKEVDELLRCCTRGQPIHIRVCDVAGTSARLKSLLLSELRQNSRFAYVSQMCMFLSQMISNGEDCLAQKRIQRFLSGTQTLCKRLHGFTLDTA